ncbi:MAG: hypothetical protein HON20_04385 [Cellvibrionales bacterium]|nr:hypothetical protein [Cellvibrionales bacterium]
MDQPQASVENTLISSSLLAPLFSQITDDKRLKILDMGMATPDTVSFFGQTKSRLQFCGLIDSQLDQYNDPEYSQAERVALFKSSLNIQADVQFDVILFWDIFCYLSAPTMVALLEVLVPHFHNRTRAHSIGQLNTRQKMVFSEYGINKIDALYHQPNNSQQPKLYAHTRHDFAKLLGYLRVDRSCLLSGNRVENLLLLNQEL